MERLALFFASLAIGSFTIAILANIIGMIDAEAPLIPWLPIIILVGMAVSALTYRAARNL